VERTVTTGRIIAANLGFPRVGRQRELKTALERYWAGEISEAVLREVGRAVRRQNWALQVELGIDHVPSNDFSLYDHVLDMAAVVGAVPGRFGSGPRAAGDLTVYFAMARGGAPATPAAPGVGPPGPAPLRMTKWFDTNYHFLVPELEPDADFELASTKPLDEFLEAKAQGIHTRPVLLGQVSLALLSRVSETGAGTADVVVRAVERLVPVYAELLDRLARAGADWVQMDEPVLALDLAPGVLRAFGPAYERLGRLSSRLRILLAAYFGGLGPNLAAVMRLPISALHLDLARAPEDLDPALAQAPATLALSLGVVDGRNVWRTDLERALSMVETACERLGPERVQVAPSCSLLHCPIDLDLETGLDPELSQWLAFGRQKLAEVVTLATALRQGRAAVRDVLARSRDALQARRASARTRNADVRARLAAVTGDMLRRRSPYAARRPQQRERLPLPPLPTTTIGSFPQTVDLRRARAAFRSGALPPADYERYVRGDIERGLREQEAIGLDVLVHGEFERADMVEYFAEELDGFALTGHGWVQSYGSRCVKPPILYGDVARRGPITVRWSRFAQSRTGKPVKGMLTGPVTLLQWSFVRDDQPRAVTCRQLALALRAEVADLEAAGIAIIQIDEPALREGLPLRRAGWAAYLDWAVDAFRLAAAGVGDATQVHTHMCYSDFDEIVEAVARMDADVLSIEGARSAMRILEALRRCAYPNEVGPGVYDIHSPRVPSPDEIEQHLAAALAVLPLERLWVNPDCGLKTRRWDEVRPALTAMVTAAHRLRAAHAVGGRT
jgi:5-methyltetrahydropteroyltriglutamate--homocysteine methyltransferase